MDRLRNTAGTGSCSDSSMNFFFFFFLNTTYMYSEIMKLAFPLILPLTVCNEAFEAKELKGRK